MLRFEPLGTVGGHQQNLAAVREAIDATLFQWFDELDLDGNGELEAIPLPIPPPVVVIPDPDAPIPTEPIIVPDPIPPQWPETQQLFDTLRQGRTRLHDAIAESNWDRLQNPRFRRLCDNRAKLITFDEKAKKQPKKVSTLCKGKTGLFNVWDTDCDGIMTIDEV